MPLENVDQIIGSNLRESGKERDALNDQRNKRYKVMKRKQIYMRKSSEKREKKRKKN